MRHYPCDEKCVLFSSSTNLESSKTGHKLPLGRRHSHSCRSDGTDQCNYSI